MGFTHFKRVLVLGMVSVMIRLACLLLQSFPFLIPRSGKFSKRRALAVTGFILNLCQSTEVKEFLV